MAQQSDGKPLIRPLIRWAGSKRRVLPTLISRTPKGFDRYIEPFAGSACLYFALNPRRAILSDVNDELVNTYLQLKLDPRQVFHKLCQRSPDEESYYKIRKQNPKRMSPVGRAARFLYLNRLCFNGLYRTNRNGKFNVPYGGGRSGGLPTLDLLEEYSRQLVSATVMHQSFEVTLKLVQKGDFVYLDPPYAIQSRRVFNEYSTDRFSTDQISILREELLRIDSIGAKFLVSYGFSREATSLAEGFRTQTVSVQRSIAGFVGNRRKSRELLITNY
jgi:DNA adenine methylase